ncbi:MAG: ANTAR domain-containing protein [Oscillospiraceae bacterium]|nr:ANTAR domain-containing protein [Oscillospiraceae bacterium]
MVFIPPKQILIVSSSESGYIHICDMLSSDMPASWALPRPRRASSGGETRRLTAEAEYDLIVINAPLNDEQGETLARDIAGYSDSDSGVILILPSENFMSDATRAAEIGVICIQKPVSRRIFAQAVMLIFSTREKLMSLKYENLRLRAKSDETRSVFRAKCLLMEKYSLTEAEAHRMIEKSAMDTRRTKRETAEEIIKTLQ